MRKKILATLGIIVILLATAGIAWAGGPNYGKAWETYLGTKWKGHVQIQASYNDAGRHAKQGYHRFIRQAGPPLDTGRLYTSVATSRSDSTTRWREDEVWDSPLYGDAYTTKYYYGFVWF